MEIGMIGLGRMGGNMVQRLLNGGHRVVTYDRSADAVTASQAQGAVGSSSLENLVGQLSQPRAVWVMVPAGQPTEDTIDSLIPILSAAALRNQFGGHAVRPAPSTAEGGLNDGC